MSKHIFAQTVGNTEYEVQIGWDKPCQHYYFVISPYISEGGHAGSTGDPIACNLYLPNPEKLTLADIKAVCEDHGIQLPADLLTNVEADRGRDTVNEIKIY